MSKKLLSFFFILVICSVGYMTGNTCSEDFGKFVQMGFNNESIAFIENSILTNLSGRYNWIELNGAFDRFIGTDYVENPSNTVYRLSDGAIMYNLAKKDMTAYGEHTIELDRYLKKTGNGNLIYVQLPFKIENDSRMPAGSSEYGNDNADDLLKQIRAAGVKTFDIRDQIKVTGDEYSKLFFKTDHHWLPQTALWAAGEIANYVDEEEGLGYDPEKYKLENYNVEVYKDWFLGSLGKRVGKYYAGVDDFYIVTPKEDTDFEIYANARAKTVHRVGPFKKSLMDWSLIERKDYYNLNTYAGYIGGDYAFNVVTNRKVDNNVKVLLLRDSFSCTMQPYLCMNYKSVTAIDMRHFKKEALYDYLDRNKFDVVIIAYNPSAFGDAQFDFAGELKDQQEEQE